MLFKRGVNPSISYKPKYDFKEVIHIILKLLIDATFSILVKIINLTKYNVAKSSHLVIQLLSLHIIAHEYNVTHFHAQHGAGRINWISDALSCFYYFLENPGNHIFLRVQNLRPQIKSEIVGRMLNCPVAKCTDAQHPGGRRMSSDQTLMSSDQTHGCPTAKREDVQPPSGQVQGCATPMCTYVERPRAWVSIHGPRSTHNIPWKCHISLIPHGGKKLLMQLALMIHPSIQTLTLIYSQYSNSSMILIKVQLKYWIILCYSSQSDRLQALYHRTLVFTDDFKLLSQLMWIPTTTIVD